MTTPNSLLPPDSAPAPPPVAPAPAPAPVASTLASEYDIADPAVPPADAVPQPVPVASAATVPPPAPPKHPRYLLAQATELGLPEAVVAGVSTEVLGELVARETKLVMQERRGQSVAAARQGDSPAVPVAAAATPAAPVPPPAFDWGEMDDEVDGRVVRRKVTDDDLHPAIAGVIKRQDARIKDLEAAIASAGQQVRANEERTIEARLDAAFSAMPRAFGEGPAAAVKGTPAFQRRKAVWAAMQEMPPEVKATMTLEAALAKCAEDLFGVKVATAATPPKPSPKPKPVPAAVVDEWNDGSLARPTNRTAPAQANGRAKAVASLSEYLGGISTGEAADGGPDVTLDEFLP